MVTAGRCGFCETCFILASIATLVQSRSFQEGPKRSDASEYDSPMGFGLLENTDNLNTMDLKTNPISSKNDLNNNNAQQPQLYDYDTTDQNKPEKQSSTEGWCVVWYLGAFGSLVCFFLIITCMELFFRMPLYRQSHLQAFIQNLHNENKPYTPESPPPPYHLFAPPDYNETVQKAADDKRKTLDIFVIPIYQGPAKTPMPAVVQQV
ncbi:uncharacterized protein LOC135843491 isoform X2 [Planococcus citri]|uniref:uncharacterized protein LOC135843491 isoform X2 n=1 Tax=Planococcus citri TaxID=170843 RepID=UPI0031F9600D